MKLKTDFLKNRTNVMTYGIVIVGFVVMQLLSSMGMLSTEKAKR